MKKLFAAIRKGDLETVKKLLEKQPDLISCIATPPPKSDAGQSLLQVALKSGSLEIAEYLIDHGADVNFIESEGCGSSWRAPVLHDAINGAIMSCRWNTFTPEFEPHVYSTEEKANAAYFLLEKILDLGADVNSLDSYGNSGIWRACMQASQILPHVNRTTGKLSNDRRFTPELEEDLHRVFRLLLAHGANLSYVRPDIGVTVLEFHKNPLLDTLVE